MSDYDVGYGKPPEASRFKHGNTAASKSKRKPKQAISFPDLITRALYRPIKYKRGNDIVTSAAAEIMIERLVRMMVNGTAREAVIIMGMIERYAPQFMASAPEVFKVEYHQAEGSNVPLPPIELWEEDRS